MNIMVTGGCGYIGTPLTLRLLEEGHRVTVVDTMWFGNFLPEHANLNVYNMDVRDIDSIPMDNADVIIHLANIANDPSVELNPALSWEVNVLGTMQLVDMAVRKGVKQFIFSSSGSIYGIKEEEQVTEELRPLPISVYNKTKMVAERVLISYADKILLHCVRPGTVCGYSPRMRLDVLVNMLTLQALVKKEITVLGGDQKRPNVHIRDMVSAICFFLEKGNAAQGIYNLSSENIQVADLAEKIAKYTGAKIVIKESNDPRSYRMNSDKIKAAGFIFTGNVDDAILEITERYRNGEIRDEDRCYNVRWMKSNIV